MKKVIFSIAISVIFLYLALRNVHWLEVKESLFGANYLWMIPAIFFIAISFIPRAIRWQYLLEQEKRISVKSLFSVIMVGFMMNNVVPARIGDLARAFLLGKKEGISRSLSFGTIVLERIFDGIALVILFGIGLFFFPMPSWAKGFVIIGLTIFGISILSLMLLKAKREAAVSLLTRLIGIFSKKISERMGYILHKFIGGLESLGKPDHIFLILFWSLVSWLLFGLEFHLLFFSFGISNLPFYAPYFVMAIVSLGTLIPSAPGYIGVFQAFCIAGLACFGIEKNLALSYSVAVHIAQYIPVTSLGLFFLAKEGISLSSLVKQKNETKD
ncbi:MAG: lysylphosphatidylglycerol synthase transmembrane domain-containing protein [bacterium]|nr:lysylphosphatidylglycerol synthase transmembrane domain-containing protein [bacterium]